MPHTPKGKTHRTYISPRGTYCSCSGAVHTDKAGVGRSPSLRWRTLTCSHTSVHNSFLPFNGLSTLVIRVITWITTHLPIQKAWKAEHTLPNPVVLVARIGCCHWFCCHRTKTEERWKTFVRRDILFLFVAQAVVPEEVCMLCWWNVIMNCRAAESRCLVQASRTVTRAQVQFPSWGIRLIFAIWTALYWPRSVFFCFYCMRLALRKT